MGCHPGRDTGALQGGGSDHLMSRRPVLRNLVAGILSDGSAVATEQVRTKDVKLNHNLPSRLEPAEFANGTPPQPRRHYGTQMDG